VTIAAGTKLDHYEVVAAIGAGGMGEVYRARDARLARDVAIKVLPAKVKDDPERLRRFETEARAAGGLNHPGILSVFDVGVHDTTPYLVTELLDGAPLRDKLRDGPLPVKKATDYAIQIALALAAAHERGIVHRDLKPANLFVTRDGRIKILDFGIAKMAEPETGTVRTITAGHTETGAVLGTAGYMAPEQVRGRDADHRADLFALGVVLHEMLTGAAPFAKETPIDRALATLNDEPPPLPDGSPALALIVRRCLEKSADERFHSARDLAFALQALGTVSSTGSAVVAQSPGRRSSWPLVAGVVGLGGIAGAFAIGRATSHDATPPPIVAAPAVARSTPLQFTRVTHRQGDIERARFGPDHKTVLFAARFDGDERFRIYSAVPGSLEPRVLVDRPLALIDVSRAGDLAVFRLPPSLELRAKSVVATMPLAGGEPRDLHEGFISGGWTPDGSFLSVRVTDGKWRIEVRDPTGQANTLVELTDQVDAPTSSPDGKHIAFLRAVRFDRRPATIELSDRNGVVRRLLAPRDRVESLSWHDDRELWYTTATQLRAVTLDGADRLVTELPGRVSLEGIAPDGRVLLIRQDGTQHKVSHRGGKTFNLTWQRNADGGELSDDGELMLFAEASITDDRYQLYVRPTDGGPAIHVGVGTALAISGDHAWTLIGTEPPINQLELVPTGPGDRKRISLGPIKEIDNASFMHDGTRLLVCAVEDGKHRVWMTDRSGTATPRPIGPLGMHLGGKPSPDDSLAIVYDGESKPFVLPLDGKSVVRGELPRTSKGPVGTNWIDSRTLFLHRYELPAGAEFPKVVVEKLDLATGRATPFMTLDEAQRPADNLFLSSFEITPDGKTYVVGYQHDNTQLYVVEGLR
jgi:eukaryotic-like serine/threonine-protein kinase